VIQKHNSISNIIKLIYKEMFAYAAVLSLSKSTKLLKENIIFFLEEILRNFSFVQLTLSRLQILSFDVSECNKRFFFILSDF